MEIIKYKEYTENKQNVAVKMDKKYYHPITLPDSLVIAKELVREEKENRKIADYSCLSKREVRN